MCVCVCLFRKLLQDNERGFNGKVVTVSDLKEALKAKTEANDTQEDRCYHSESNRSGECPFRQHKLKKKTKNSE